MRTRTIVFAASLWLLAASAVWGQSWVTSPSYFTHDPQTGQRVSQYAEKAPSMLHTNPNRTQSGMRHVRVSLQAGNSASHTHVVEQWGAQPVRPYGEWRFPYRPYGVPYGLWGPPPNVFWGAPWGGVAGGGGVGGGAGGAVVVPPFDPYAPRDYSSGDPRTRNRPYDDGRYPSSRRGDDPTRRFEPYTPRGW